MQTPHPPHGRPGRSRADDRPWLPRLILDPDRADLRPFPGYQQLPIRQPPRHVLSLRPREAASTTPSLCPYLRTADQAGALYRPIHLRTSNLASGNVVVQRLIARVKQCRQPSWNNVVGTVQDKAVTDPAAALPDDYPQFLDQLKGQVRHARLRATRVVNTELLVLYWDLGRAIAEQQQTQGWGTKVIDRLASDLRSEFPQMRGLSRSNLFYMRQMALLWPRSAIVQQPVLSTSVGLSGTG
nr:DUF1016 N-terminal domain-containing protein [Rhodococcus sp. 14C212]